MLFFRIFQHLLPRARAWRTTIETTLRQFFEGLAGAPQAVRDFFDAIHNDRLPETTRELAEWERQFGLVAPSIDAERRQQLAAAWQATGGQSPRYLQDVVQAAGFDLYIHEWWEMPETEPRVPRNPLDYTSVATIGTFQCSEFEDQPQCQDELAGQPQCNDFLANVTGYLVNDNLTLRPPPPIPNDPTKWPYFLYWGAETFGDSAIVLASRRAELERLLLKLCPMQQWLVLMVTYVEPLYDDEGDMIVDGDGETVYEG